MPYRSHLSQVLQNYFDASDVRTRRTPWTLEGQLLNSAACSVEEMQWRMQREISARQLRRTPLNLDNGGLWYRVPVPASVQNPLPVVGYRNGSPVSLSPYNDLLPVPSRIEFDSSRTPVEASSLVLWSTAGTGLPQTSGALSLAVPNKLYFWLEGIGDYAGLIQIQISGYAHPHTFWAANAEPISELIQISDDGPFASSRTWSSVTDVSVRGLPQGATLQICLFPWALPMQPDTSRPLAVSVDRDVLYERRWRVNGRAIEEGFATNRWVGFNPVRRLMAPADIQSVTLEPNTYGILMASSTSLTYGDRRVPVPENLYRSAIAVEPTYGLRVNFDALSPQNLYQVKLTPDAYDNAGGVIQYRLSVADPQGTLWAITGSGDLSRYSSNAGWIAGAPAAITVGLPDSWFGTSWFTLETIDGRGNITADSQPFVSEYFSGSVSWDVTEIVPSLAGAGFDSKERLWLWTGSFLVPAQFHYDAYIYDPDSQAVYVTDSYDQVSLG